MTPDDSGVQPTPSRPSVAVFRPADDRIDRAVSVLRELGVEPVADPMLAVEPTGAIPRDDADYTVLTSKTGVDLIEGTDWRPGGTLCAIGEPTAVALRTAGFSVDIVPDVYSSTGLVEYLAAEVDGARIEVARSDHGSPVLLDGLEAAGGYLHETILYELVRPPDSGRSTEAAADRRLDAALFTSSLTVEHFLEAAAERGVRDEATAGLEAAVVGAIGEPTRETAEAHDITVDVVPETVAFEPLARTVVGSLESDRE